MESSFPRVSLYFVFLSSAFIPQKLKLESVISRKTFKKTKKNKITSYNQTLAGGGLKTVWSISCDVRSVWPCIGVGHLETHTHTQAWTGVMCDPFTHYPTPAGVYEPSLQTADVLHPVWGRSTQTHHLSETVIPACIACCFTGCCEVCFSSTCLARIKTLRKCTRDMLARWLVAIYHS